MNFEIEAVMVEVSNDGSQVKCRLKPTAGGSAVEVGGTRYLVGRKEIAPKTSAASKPTPIAAKLWPLNTSGATETEFDLGTGLDQWARAAWEAQRKVRLIFDDAKASINKISLL